LAPVITFIHFAPVLSTGWSEGIDACGFITSAAH
jgi:hypothetical protein